MLSFRSCYSILRSIFHIGWHFYNTSVCWQEEFCIYTICMNFVIGDISTTSTYKIYWLVAKSTYSFYVEFFWTAIPTNCFSHMMICRQDCVCCHIIVLTMYYLVIQQHYASYFIGYLQLSRNQSIADVYCANYVMIKAPNGIQLSKIVRSKLAISKNCIFFSITIEHNWLIRSNEY